MMRGKGSFRRWAPFTLSVLLTLLVACSMASAADGKAKNVIMMIADGCSSEQYTFVRWYKGGSLSFDNYMVGAIKTYIADSVVPDSAPAASAIATGVRTSDKFISVGPSENTIPPVPRPPKDLQYRPLATVLEGARLLGKSTGIVVTSRVSHATPAAFVAHVPVRKMENDIMEQAVYQNIDVVFGGGKLQLIPIDSGGKRSDGENLVEVLKQKGYQIVETRDEMMQVDSGRVFGMFAGSHMAAEIDRKQIARAQPTLAEMTEKAIEILSKDPDGFFLMVEGSQVDWACHANDPAHLVSDLLMYDRAVKTALDFAKENGNTLVLAFSDHNTGGFSLGNSMTNDTYSQMKPDALLDPVKKMKASSSLLWKHVGDEKTAEKVRIVVMQDWGIEISDEEAARILTLAEAYQEDPNYAFGEVICPRYTYLGWTTHGHVGGDVPLFAFGPAKPAGLLDAPDMGKVTAAAMGLDMDKLNERLFVDTTERIEGAVVAIDKTNAENPILKVEYQGTIVEFPANKNLMRLGNKVTELEGVVVYIPSTGKGYLPMQAVRTITGSTEPLPAITE